VSSKSSKKDEQAKTSQYLKEVGQSISYGTEINSGEAIDDWLCSFVTAREKCQKKVLLYGCSPQMMPQQPI